MDFKSGTFLMHPAWGLCRIQLVEKDKLFVLFESGKEEILVRGFAEKKCEFIDDQRVSSTSPLRTKFTPATPLKMRVPPPPPGDAKDRTRPCASCREPLNRSISANQGKLKSCPNCSALNAEANQHVFHPFPSAFGTTDKRVSEQAPDGRQSWCEVCRADHGPLRGTPCNRVSFW